AEDGIRDDLVTGVQTCALPISVAGRCPQSRAQPGHGTAQAGGELLACRFQRPFHRHRPDRRLVNARRVLESIAEQDAETLALAQIGRASVREKCMDWLAPDQSK